MDAQSDLIFDIGVNKGEDTEFYLAKGFRVVGVEANPQIFRDLTHRFATAIDSDRLVILNQGIWSEATTLKFYVNLDNDHWSSFDAAYGCRQNTRFETVDIPCLTILDLVNRYGVPRFMKIDVEGADKLIVADLARWKIRPPFVSIEEFGVAAVDALQAVGYDRFQFTAQRDKKWARPPKPPREGEYVEKRFTGYDSGLFGRELPGAWLAYDEARAAYVQQVRNEEGTYVGPEHEWFDIHATMAAEVESPQRASLLRIARDFLRLRRPLRVAS